jgi:hypothetical protein
MCATSGDMQIMIGSENTRMMPRLLFLHIEVKVLGGGGDGGVGQDALRETGESGMMVSWITVGRRLGWGTRRRNRCARDWRSWLLYVHCAAHSRGGVRRGVRGIHSAMRRAHMTRGFGRASILGH